MKWNKEQVPRDFYVYKLIDPRTNTPYYVGKGKNKRAYFHLNEALSTSKKSAKLNTIRDIIASGHNYTIEVVSDGMSEVDACEMEISLIVSLGRRNYDSNGVLTNILKSTKQADFSKVIYRRGEDHHSFGNSRKQESIEKQKETCRLKAEATGLFKCICGCGFDMSDWRKNQSRAFRDKYGYAEHHFREASNNYERSAIMKTLRGKSK